jgi:putative membrane protein
MISSSARDGHPTRTRWFAGHEVFNIAGRIDALLCSPRFESSVRYQDAEDTVLIVLEQRFAPCYRLPLAMSATFAFLHHIAAFVFAAALAIEFVLIRDELTLRNARTLLFVDAVLGAAAGAILVVGLLRVFFFEKGAAYYFHSLPFIVKLSLFAIIGLLSIYPTRKFLSWRGSIRQGVVPTLEPATQRAIRKVIHWELAGLVVLILCAALMARGIGYVGA